MKYPVLWGLLFPAVVVALAIPLSNVIIPGVAAATPATTATLPVTAPPQATTAGVPPQPASTASPSKPAVAVQAAPAAAVRTTPPIVAAAPDQVQTVQYVDQSRRVIDQVTAPAYTTDASYSIGSLTQDTPALVEGAHVDLVRANCSVCHATTFISSQPPLPGSLWHDEVYKMKLKYGATFISNETADQIIAYLSAHYTPETHASGTASTAPSAAGSSPTTAAKTNTVKTTAAPATPAASTAGVDGAAVYTANCASCHGVAGAGVPGAFPPLAGNPAVTGDGKYVADVLINGLQGQIAVNGQPYNGVMPAWAAQLSDAQIAAVLTHIRSQWGNQGAAISADTVNAERARPTTAAQRLTERPH